jgi:CopG family nickel-responsive transcriptional regulator
MQTLERFGVSMSRELLRRFDQAIHERGYRTRSEAIRDVVRNYLVESEWSLKRAEVVGTITLIYDHGAHDLPHVLSELQHQFHDKVLCTTHVHLDQENCLEVVVLRGPAEVVRAVADRLTATRGVKHGKLVCTTTGASLA